MPINNVFLSGVQQTTGGVNLSTPPQSAPTFTKELVMLGITASTAAGSFSETAVTRPIWTADAPAQVVGLFERHSVLGSTTGMLVYATGSTPLGSASNVLSTTVSLTAAVDVTQSGTLFNSTGLTKMATGDQIGWRWGTPGNAAPTGLVTVIIEYV
jgi:hypothetical protein